jgi:HEAT repeat protein
MKRRRLLWAGGVLAGLLVGVPVLLWSGYAVLALLRHEHFYHGLPSSWWRRQFSLIGPCWDPQQRTLVPRRYYHVADALSRSRFAPVTDYLGMGLPPNGVGIYTDPAAAPMLCDFIRDGDAYTRVIAAQSLAEMRLYPEVAVPELIAVLKEDLAVRPYRFTVVAMNGLARFGPEAVPAVPVLLDVLNWDRAKTDGDAKEAQRFALQTLRAIEPDNMDLLIRLLESPNWEVRADVAQTLGYRFGPKAKAAVPSLVRMLGERDNPMTARTAALALLRIDPEAAHKAGVPKGYE